MQSAEQRSISLTARSDLEITEGEFQCERCWIVKDPIALKYYRLRGPEYFVFERLDGDRSLNQIKQEIDSRFPLNNFSTRDLNSVIASFHQNGLTLTPHGQQGEVLIDRQWKQRKQKIFGLLKSALSMKFPGVDPDRFLTAAYPFIRWFYSIPATIVFFFLIASAGLLVLSNLDLFYSKLPSYHQFFTGNNLVYLGVLLIITKTIHEFGHGFTCKHFGGECHEMGFMLLVMMPAMYCNTSDSWVLSNKWKRISIGAGGMYVELILASLCTWIWWNTSPGTIHYICLNIMFLSSVSTVVFNANPLLRYDGYFILSDWLEIPNLSQKAQSALMNLLRRWCLGMPAMSKRMLPDRHQFLFMLYSIASFLYRWFVVFSILWFVSDFFEPYGLEVIAHILIIFSVATMIGTPAWSLYKFFEHPGRRKQVKRKNFLISASIVAVLLGLFFFLPLPRYVNSVFVVNGKGVQYLYVPSDAVLKNIHVKPGQAVKKGDVIVSLEDLALEQEIARLHSEIEGLKTERQHAENRNVSKTGSGKSIDVINAELRKKRVMLFSREQKKDSLKIVSDREGIIFSPLEKKQPPTLHGELPTWSGSPLDPANIGATLEKQTQICSIASKGRMKATLVLGQSDVDLFEEGATVLLQFDERPWEWEKSQVERISYQSSDLDQSELKSLSSQNGGPLETVQKPDGMLKPMFTTFPASVPLDGIAESTVPGMRGKAKIYSGTATPAQRTWRWLNVLFQFR